MTSAIALSETAGRPPAATSRVKRAVDLVLGGVAAILALPFVAAACTAVILETGWPPLYSQQRAGLRGRPFRIWKIRTMIKEADSLKAALASDNEAPWPAFKVSRDPRVTRVGRLLRKASVDELPQLWNVLSGDMSLVGPRPLPVEENDRLDAEGHRRLEARPGITGTWQVSNRHRTDDSFESWLRQDLDYIATWSITRDLELILKTVPAVLRLTGK